MPFLALVFRITLKINTMVVASLNMYHRYRGKFLLRVMLGINVSLLHRINSKVNYCVSDKPPEICLETISNV